MKRSPLQSEIWRTFFFLKKTLGFLGKKRSSWTIYDYIVSRCIKKGLKRLHNIEVDCREWFTKDGYEIAQSFEEQYWSISRFQDIRFLLFKHAHIWMGPIAKDAKTQKQSKPPDLPRKKWSLKNNFDAGVFFSNETWNLGTIVFTEPKYLGIGRFRFCEFVGVSLQQSTYLIQCVQLSSRMENPKPFEVLKIGNIKRPPTTNISRKNLSNNTTSNPSKTTESSEVLFGKKLGLFTSTTPLPRKKLLPRYCCSPQ